ncbi:SRPBCC domain-containing protein [Octadecabacter ascidiaceicola]|uniref:SRPBCC domain-containing protein n=1 Tax=Octadecabacter ascidiaceicola TaxID=1655543 RepID=UPI0035230C05
MQRDDDGGRPKRNPEQVYDALTGQIKLWWSNEVSFERDHFTIGFGETKKSFRTATPDYNEAGYEIVWKCTQANLLHPEVQTPNEWVGTNIIWAIEPHPSGAKITMTHDGLNEALECFDICAQGWDFFFLDSLKGYLATGQGKPFTSLQAV